MLCSAATELRMLHKELTAAMCDFEQAAALRDSI